MLCVFAYVCVCICVCVSVCVSGGGCLRALAAKQLSTDQCSQALVSGCQGWGENSA